jgi:hypothetical protein
MRSQIAAAVHPFCVALHAAAPCEMWTELKTAGDDADSVAGEAAGCDESRVLLADATSAAVAALDRASAENVALRAFAESFAVTADAAVAAAERPKGGQQVPFHGDFAGSPPSTIGRLRWWAARAREALGGAQTCATAKAERDALRSLLTEAMTVIEAGAHVGCWAANHGRCCAGAEGASWREQDQCIRMQEFRAKVQAEAPK